MQFYLHDFKRPTELPDLTPGTKDVYAFCIEYGPRLIGPFRVVIEAIQEPDPDAGKLVIRPPGRKHPYWSDYGKPNQWGDRGSYLVFVTLDQLKADPIHSLHLKAGRTIPAEIVATCNPAVIT